MKHLVWMLLFLPAVSFGAQVEYLMIKLMQPGKVIEAKTGPVDDMGRYIKEVETEINQKLALEQVKPGWGFLVIAVRDDGRIKAWLDTDDVLPDVVTQTMTSVAESTEAFHVKSGAVVFALGFGVNGGSLPPYTLPFPSEWKKVANCSNEDCMQVDVEQLVLTTWPKP
jgi:hypothetical protein